MVVRGSSISGCWGTIDEQNESEELMTKIENVVKVLLCLKNHEMLIQSVRKVNAPDGSEHYSRPILRTWNPSRSEPPCSCLHTAISFKRRGKPDTNVKRSLKDVEHSSRWNWNKGSSSNSSPMRASTHTRFSQSFKRTSEGEPMLCEPFGSGSGRSAEDEKTSMTSIAPEDRPSIILTPPFCGSLGNPHLNQRDLLLTRSRFRTVRCCITDMRFSDSNLFICDGFPIC
jgi:hypothetical protein